MIWDFVKMLWGKGGILLRPNNANTASKSFFLLETKTINGQKFNFSQLKGKKTLIINTASNCGFTPQLALLEDFYRIYGDKVNVLGFPCNDFFNQDPENNAQIALFCEREFKVTFPLFEKISIKKQQISPVFEWLSNKELNGWNSKKPNWNFCKYLIDENGELLLFANSRITPTHPNIIVRVES